MEEEQPKKRMYEFEIEGEKIFIKRSFLGSRIVHPFKIDGKINWKNLLIGSWFNLITIIIYILIAVLLYVGLQQIVQQCQMVLDNPCPYCNQMLKNISTNFSIFNSP